MEYNSKWDKGLALYRNNDIAALEQALDNDQVVAHPIMTSASEDGNLDVMRLVHPFTDTDQTTFYHAAILEGQLEALKLLEHLNQLATPRDLLPAVARQPNLEMLDYLYPRLDDMTEAAFATAFKYRNIEVIRYFVKRGAPLTDPNYLRSLIHDIPQQWKLILELYLHGANPNMVGGIKDRSALKYMLYRATPNKQLGYAVAGYEAYFFIHAMEKVRVTMSSILPLSSDLISYIFDMNYPKK